ncbi:MAG: hypothetical protein ACTSRC_12450 [Candidatus Helarchaeota archaeon]
MSKFRKLTTLSFIVVLLVLPSLPSISNDIPGVSTTSSDSELCSTATTADPFALENNGTVFYSGNGSNPWLTTGKLPSGYEFVSTAADNNNTYVLTSDGQIWRHSNVSWNNPTWSQLQVPLPNTSVGWKSIDVSQTYIYVLRADGDVYRILKDPGWPNPGTWVRGSNPIPLVPNPPMVPGATSYVSLAVDWWDMFCFVLRNNGEVYRHECDGSPLLGNWTSTASLWQIYASYGGPAPFTLEHGDGSGLYWGIPSTGWVSIDVFDNTFEPNYTVYALHNSGLVARHTNLMNWIADFWLNPIVPWELDPRWPTDWLGPWGMTTAFESIALNDLDIFIMKNTGEVFYVPELDFIPMLITPSWWLIPVPSETQTSAFTSIDAWTEPFIMKNDGKEWRNIPYRIAPYWDDCWDNNQKSGQGTLYPSIFAYSSIAAYNQNILFVLSKNGSIYKSIDAGINWQKFGDLGYGNDSAWVSIAAPNFMNHTYIYALYNNGTVARTTVNTFSPQVWGICDLGPPDTSWVSIACDGNATVYTLRNFGSVSFRFQGGPWQVKGTTKGNKIHQDSSWVCIEAYHVSYGIYALRNDQVMDTSAAGSNTIWINFNPVSLFTSFVAMCITPASFSMLRNNGLVYNLVALIGVIPGDTGFVDICSYIDNLPWDNNPPDMIVSKTGNPSVSWTLYDDVALDTFIIWEDGTPVNSGALSGVQATVGTPINNQKSGSVLNYTIFYNDSIGNSNTDSVLVTVDWYPWGNSTGSFTTAYNDTTPTHVNWSLYDDWGPSHFRILVNQSPTNWLPWLNGTFINYPISRATIGVYNYTIEYNDSRNQFSTNTILVTVNDPYAPWSNNPGPIITNHLGSQTIDWRLWDGFAPGYYYVLVNNTPSPSATWSNGSNLQYPINRTIPGEYNYTIVFNDSAGNPGPAHTVWVTVQDLPPSSNTPSDIVVQVGQTATIPWILTDDYGAGLFTVYINGTPSTWQSWSNGISIDYSINTTVTGTFNYTIVYNDSNGNFGTPHTIWVEVRPTSTGGGIPSFQLVFALISIVALTVIVLRKTKINPF